MEPAESQYLRTTLSRQLPSSVFVLKLYDRRFAEQLRQDHDAGLWSPQIEDEYRKFVHDGSATAFFDLCSEKDGVEWAWKHEAGKEWSQAQREAYLQYSCLKFCRTESSVYNGLSDMEGHVIPRLWAMVRMRSSSAHTPSAHTLPHDYFDCPGILLEYIEGFPLTDIALNAPREDWQKICEDAIQIINRIGDRHIRNKDVKTRSFIVRKDPQLETFSVFMIDFGECVLRNQDESEYEWRKWKAMQDEEGAIGMVMQRKLDGGFKYTRTLESEKLMDEFQRED
ncbi:hypothetical protein EV356DRAFT_515618 [Viridothelium virens]|uniref:Protein kinase domain-containing protein n=1 Tax=Viridothelium virens TaxID=1048519 RepID=A0A6A6H8C1_VIRVR|nr:hypothetical protein EV356DRAFT_515618 [Viridothelium virens]